MYSAPAVTSKLVRNTIRQLHDVLQYGSQIDERSHPRSGSSKFGRVPTSLSVAARIAKLEEKIGAGNRSPLSAVAPSQNPLPAHALPLVNDASVKKVLQVSTSECTRPSSKTQPAAAVTDTSERKIPPSSLDGTAMSEQYTPSITEDAAHRHDAPGETLFKQPTLATTRKPTASSLHLKPTDNLRDPPSRPISVHFRDDPIMIPRRASSKLDPLSQYGLGLPPALKINGEDYVEDTHGPEPNQNESLFAPRLGHESHFTGLFGVPSRAESLRLAHSRYSKSVDIGRLHHIDLPGSLGNDFDDHQNCHHAPVARNWPITRKRFTAAVACINSACIGLILGIYAGEVPAIQYVIVDVNHRIILGNVVLYICLALGVLILWPLPLLHGRKPYITIGLFLSLCLQVPQGVAASLQRLPDTSTWMAILLLSRALSGFTLAMVDVNLHSTLLDLFGASLQSRHPHGEIPDQFDVRRHGSGLGLWLGIWSWCSIGPISLGFLIGAAIINNYSVTWGFSATVMILMAVLLLNIVSPEVRRSAFRRTLAEIRGLGGSFSRVARGEIKMHLESMGPAWWGEEVFAGLRLCGIMIKQVGFFVLSLYSGWVYAEFTLILMLLGALASRAYLLKAIDVGLCVFALAAGSLFACPFQKASWLSRARRRAPTSGSMTLGVTTTWSSHLVRRTVFTLVLPLTAIAYTFTSQGPPILVVVPCLMASFVGFFSTLALSECYGLLFETFDTSDLQPGMTGKPFRQSVIQRCSDQRTNFSCYPRISAGLAIMQAIKYILAAAATGLGGRVERRLGTLRAASVVAAILLGLTILLTLILARFKTVRIIPDVFSAGEKLEDRKSIWEPIVMGRPSSKLRKISLLEAGRMTRWSEIRRRNKITTGLTD